MRIKIGRIFVSSCLFAKKILFFCKRMRFSLTNRQQAVKFLAILSLKIAILTRGYGGSL